ncbi:DsbA family protein [Salipaludibacillus sp. CUR1]|uniref:DsbA family oxidoreductase n=1 Tax=Salipaludibacillus sp. CUR1 TaxID=2820003 RepID=UPI001F1F9473|nr:DsbA family protein [Salipaludibacillus sp. CUR1]
MAEAPLFEAIKGKDVEVEWLPFELRPYPQQTLSPKSDYIQQAWHQSVLPYAEKLGVRMNLPMVDPQPHTHFSHEGLLYAKEHGKGNDYADRVFKAFYEEGRNIGDISVLGGLAAELDLNRKEFEEALTARRYSEEREKWLKHARTTDMVQAVPTFFIGEKKLTGLQPRAAFEKALSEEK